MQKGYLITNVYTANRLFPVGGAQVIVYKNGEVIAYRQTNKNGVAPVVVISSPDKNLSESPGNNAPYSTVDVAVKANGFEPLIFKGVQVFAGETSILNADMIPLADNPELYNSGEINIKPQNL